MGECISRQPGRTAEAKPPSHIPSGPSLLSTLLSGLLSPWYQILLKIPQSFPPWNFMALVLSLGLPECHSPEERYTPPGPLA